jgi:hypothetical protein
MCCSTWLIAIVLVVATWAAIAGGLPRTKPNLFVPLVVASLGWALAAVCILWRDYFTDPKDVPHIPMDLLFLDMALVALTSACVIWGGASLLIDWYRKSGK